MAAGVSIDFPMGEISDIVRQMNRFQRDFGKEAADAVKFTAWSLSKALGASTNIAPRKRKIIRQYDIVKMGSLPVKVEGKGQWFDIESFKGNRGRREFQIKATSLSAARNDPRVKIGARGLAKRMWGLSQRVLGSASGAQTSTSNRTESIARKNLSIIKHLSGNDPSVTIVNKLEYATKAFKQQGEQTVSTAADRAARHMERILDAKKAKMLGVRLWK